ncbi:MAG TPA: hypothetical protein VNO52_08085, partial [Methylomirabilota bacterium]|nr:hypothetical protein [Methylomirabilota bacterium]
MNRSRLQWYWHRLRAMSAGEVLHHALKKGHEFRDARRPPKWSQATLDPSGPFPRIPEASRAPEA